MGEPIWTTVNVRLPDGWPTDGDVVFAACKDSPGDTLPGALWAIHTALWGSDTLFEEGEFVASGEANYGLCDDSLRAGLDALQRLGVPYRAHDETKYDMTGSVEVFDGTEVNGGPCDNDGDPVMGRYAWLRIVEQHGLTEQAARAVDEILNPPWLTSSPTVPNIPFPTEDT